MKSKDLKFFMVGAVGTTAVLLVCILCGLIVILKPGGWEIPSWPLLAAATPSPQAAVDSTPAPPLSTSLQGVLFHDDFSLRDTSAAKGWNLTPDEHFERIWSPNRLTILAKDAEQRYLQTVVGDYKDLGVEIEAQPDVEDIFYGILFRQNEAGGTLNYYFYFVTTDGYYFLYKVIGDELTPLVNGAPSTHLTTGLVKNRLGVLTEGSTISLYINGHLEKTLNDDSLSSGSAGVVVFRASEGQGQVHFSRVTVYSVERAKTELANPDNTMATTLAGVLFYDDFSSEQASKEKGWLSGTPKDADETWAPGKLTVSLKEKNKVYSSNPGRISYALGDCGVEIEAQPEDNPGTEYGIVFRRSDGGRDGYYFGATLDGQYSLVKETDGEWAGVVPMTSSPHLKPGPSKNRLGVLVEGPVISLYINGLLVKTVTDDSLASGSVALFAQSGKDALACVAFNSMTVLTVERAKAEWGAPAILFHDDFSSEQMSKDNGWAFGSKEFFDLLWSPNKMTMTIRQNNKKVTNLPNGTFKDFGVEIEVQPGSDPGTEYGILFRCSLDRSTCYYFTVSTDGQYFLVKNIGGNPADKDVVSLTDSPYLKRGSARNRLGVLAEGSTFSLYVNGTRVTTVSDDSIQSGAVGVFVQASGDRAQADVYRMTVLSVEKAKAEWGATGILFHEDFSSEEASREKGFETRTGADADLTWSPGKFTITVKKEQALEMVVVPAGTLADFGVEVEAEPADYPRTEYGLFFRLNEGESGVSHYVFGVTTEGNYHLFKKINGQWAEPDPVEQTPSPYLNPPPAKNRLGVLVEGSTISLYINGHLVETLSDDSLASGQVGVFVASTESDQAQVTFSRLTVYTVEKARTELGKR